MLWDNYPPKQRKWLIWPLNGLKSNLSTSLYINNKTIMATIYKTSGEVIETTPKNGTDFSLSELQAIVSGYIEIINLFDGRIMVVNEEGKLNGLGINLTATRIFDEAFPTTIDVIVGDVLVCDKSQIK